MQPANDNLENAVIHLHEPDTGLQAIMDTIPAIVWCGLPDGSKEFLNKRWRDYTGLSSEESYGWGWQAAVHPEDLPLVSEKWRELAASEEPGEIEARVRGHEGGFRWFLIRVEPLRDTTGKIVRWYGTSTDIDGLKQTELLRAAEKLTLEMIADGASLKDVLTHLCNSIDVQVSPSVTTVLVMDDDEKHLVLTAGPRVPNQWVSAVSPRPITSKCGLCGRAAFLKRRVIVSDVATDPDWPDEYREAAIRNGIRAAWSEPILTKDNQVLGTFALYSTEPRVPTDADLALIEGAGRIALIAIERQRSRDTLRRALDEIRNSETTLRRVIDTIPVCAWCNLPDGSNEFVNKRWRDYTGLSSEGSCGWGWQAAVDPEHLPLVSEQWRKLQASGEPGEIEARLRRHDGAYCWFLLRFEPLRDETGTIVRWYGTSTDIETLKRTEKNLREDERELRRITDAISQAVVVQDPTGLTLYANQALLDYTGLTIEDVVAPHFRERIFHPEDLEKVRDERQAALARGIPFEIEQRMLGADGQYRWFLGRYKPFRDEQGRVIRWYATGTDIDDRVRAEERTRHENLALREQINRDSMFEDIVGSSEALRRVLNQVAKVAPSDSTILILGESGTGKELIARAIHKRSNRAARAFIAVNCASIPTSLIASELFGHEKGAFTGATQRRIGRFESANGGTLFLDEVGDLPPEIQIALLRVLQEHEIERVGSGKAISIDVRVLAATHRDLNVLVADGMFRRDLLYRLNVVPIELPSLAQRAADIPLLVEYFIDRIGKKAGKKFRTIDRNTLELFQAYDWPGNVRELQNVVERAVILSDGDTFAVDESWLKPEARQVRPNRGNALSGALHRHEKEMIEAALAESQGRISGPAGAAAKLGLPAQTLEAKIKRLDIDKFRFKLPHR
jgi:PAS domain S-box-containing protein